MSEIMTCSVCGCEIGDDSYEVEDEILICEDCYYDATFCCEGCGNRFFNNHNFGDENICLCESCRNEDYYACTECGCLVYTDDVCWYEDDPYCSTCYEEDDDENYIHSYSYKPEPRFCKCCNEKKIRYYGVELEIDRGGFEEDNATSSRTAPFQREWNSFRIHAR